MKTLGQAALKIIKGIAPVAASAIGGPFAGAAMSIIAKTLGIDEEKIDDYILSASPDQLLDLRKAGLEFDKWREEAGIRKDELVVQDREGARSLAKERGIVIQAVLSALFIGGYFWMVWFVVSTELFNGMDDFAKGQVAILIGVLTAAVPQILAFWFGSSRGSKEKTEAMAAAFKGSH